MTRLIDADALQKEMWDKCAAECGCCPYEDENLHKRCGLINNAPTVEITEEMAIDRLIETGWLYEHDKEMTERPHGEWIDVDEDWFDYKCSICGLHSRRYWDYCPNCGAKMTGVKKNDRDNRSIL